MSWRRFLKRRYWDAERRLEIDAYLEAETADNIARGMAAAEAAAAARRTFGNATLIREEIYRMNTVSWLESIAQDVRYGARLLAKSPGFTVVAVASLALGIGANTAIFQLVDAVRLRRLPVQNPHELAEIKITGGNGGIGLNDAHGELTRPIWEEIRRSHPSFSGVFAWGVQQQIAGKGSNAEPVNSLMVSGDLFRTLGVQPWRGRSIGPDDEHTCPDSTVMVSHAFWQGKLGSREIDSDTKLIVDGAAAQVIGVTPPSFFGLAVGESFDIVRPFCEPPRLMRNVFDVTVMGRLRPGVSLSQASAQLAGMSPGIMAATEISGYDAKLIAHYRQYKLAAYSAATGVSYLRDSYDSSLQLLLGITGLVLLIACANLANLMLARATTREREIAVRLALGARRMRLLRQLLVESSLVAAIGAVLGVALAQALSRVLVHALSSEDSVVTLSTGADLPVLLFASAVAMLTCLIFGMLPAFRASGADPGLVIRAGGRSMTASRERFSIQRIMVVFQIAVSLVLLFSALLFVRSFHNLLTFDPGMREKGVSIAFIGFRNAHRPWGSIEEYKGELVEEIRSIPGVENAASTTNTPLMGNTWGHGVTVGGVDGMARFTWVSPGYFDTMGIRLLNGRDFNQNDSTVSTRVAVVNQTFIRRYLKGINPLGQTVRTHAEPNYPSSVYEIVGTISDTKYEDLRADTPPMAFAPAAQFPDQRPWTAIMIHTNLPAAVAAESVKHRIADKHPEIIVECRSFEARIQGRLLRERIMALLSGFFGVLAIVLATTGLYGVINYVVTRRRNEIGIRIAIGAGRGKVVQMVMREALLSVACGVGIGTVLALAAGRVSASLLFGLKPYDPLTLSASIVMLVVIGAFAAFLPASRASKLDPAEALRCD
jgi:predicted permease